MENVLEIKNLDLFFKQEENEFQALYDINLTFDKGKIHSIVGESGCGKTTLLRLLKSAIAPFGDLKGSICFEGAP